MQARVGIRLVLAPATNSLTEAQHVVGGEDERQRLEVGGCSTNETLHDIVLVTTQVAAVKGQRQEGTCQCFQTRA